MSYQKIKVAVIMDGEVSFSIPCSSVQGDRCSMEDELAIQFLDKNHAILGIFDGHCGREAAAYAKTILFCPLLSTLRGLIPHH